jgi:hypothetical protein
MSDTLSGDASTFRLFNQIKMLWNAPGCRVPSIDKTTGLRKNASMGCPTATAVPKRLIHVSLQDAWWVRCPQYFVMFIKFISSLDAKKGFPLFSVRFVSLHPEAAARQFLPI